MYYLRYYLSQKIILLQFTKHFHSYHIVQEAEYTYFLSFPPALLKNSYKLLLNWF